MMGANTENDFAGKQPIGVGEVGLGDCVHTTTCRDMPKETTDSQTDGNYFKRVRQIDDEQTSVQVIFKSLSRKSKKKLEELLHQWSEWHARECSISEGSDEDLEFGEETYFPALNISADKSCTISFYMDNQVKKKQRMDDAQFNKGSVPVYDRDSEFALISGDRLADKESVVNILNACRCFNCGAYDHSLKECSKPFNKEVVNNARKLHQLKSKRPAGSHVLTRYYQETPGGKFDGLKPGCLDPQTRKLLGLGEFDPPPWLNRMRELGYPPGYLDLEDDNQPSGIIIYANGDPKEENYARINTNSTDPKRKMSVNFPGINAPIPIQADRNRWANPNFKPRGFNFYSNNNDSPLNHWLESSHELCFRGHTNNPNWLPDCRQEFRPFRSDHALSYQKYEHAVPLLSNYANNYLHHINQPSPHFSSYAYQNSWSSFHG